MHATTVLTTALLATLSAAIPAAPRSTTSTTSYTDGDACGLTDFYLVTTTSPGRKPASSALPGVSAISLFDPNYETTYTLRTIAAGYNSLPTFNLTDGQLQTLAEGPHGTGPELVYENTLPTAGSQLSFETGASPNKGKLSLELVGGHLLSLKGAPEQAHGWTLCDGEFGETVIYWKGTDASCKKTFIQAVSKPPY